jgi:hypothetical protein
LGKERGAPSGDASLTSTFGTGPNEAEVEAGPGVVAGAERAIAIAIDIAAHPSGMKNSAESSAGLIPETEIPLEAVVRGTAEERAADKRGAGAVLGMIPPFAVKLPEGPAT